MYSKIVCVPWKTSCALEGAQFDDVVGAIRLFQSVIFGLEALADDWKKADGAIHPDSWAHLWLRAPNAPGWVKLQQPAGFEIVQDGDVHTSTWLAGVLMSAVSSARSRIQGADCCSARVQL